MYEFYFWCVCGVGGGCTCTFYLSKYLMNTCVVIFSDIITLRHLCNECYLNVYSSEFHFCFVFEGDCVFTIRVLAF